MTRKAARLSLVSTTSPDSSKRGFGTGAGRKRNPYSRTRVIAKAMILAAELESPDGTLIGFCRKVAQADPVSFLKALMRVSQRQDWHPQFARWADLYDTPSNDAFYKESERHGEEDDEEDEEVHR